MRRLTLDVSGMKCEGCATNVGEALSAVEGVRRAEVSLEDGRAEVIGSDDLEVDALRAAVEECGYESSPAGLDEADG